MHQLRTTPQHLRQISHHSFWRGICFERPNNESLAKRARGNVVPEFVVNHDGANIEKVRAHRDGVNYSINVFDPDGNRWELSFAKEN